MEKTDTSIFTLTGTMGKKDRKQAIVAVREYVEKRNQFCLFSTGSLIGEGFDLPELDTMLITMPISFKGRLTQYVGRLHRQTSPEQKEIVVYDYVDTCSGMTISMFKKRLAAYKKLGYIPVYDPGNKIAKWL
jgi:superfamily II DNA or RNA helicase